MTSRLQLEWEWLDGARASIRSHALTWSRFVCRVDDRVLTRVLSVRTHSARDGVYVPLMPLAEWLVANWWFVMGEGAPAGLGGSSPRVTTSSSAWFRRHNLLFAREGYPLPDLTIVREDDELVRLRASRDERVYGDAPVRFIEDADVLVGRDELRAELTGLLDAVTERLASCEDADARDLVELWSLRRDAAPEEQRLALRAAALGRDVDDPDEVGDAELADLRSLGEGMPESLVAEVLELRGGVSLSSAGAEAVRVARELRRTGEGSALRDARAKLPRTEDHPPHRAGWELARAFRSQVLGVDERLLAVDLDRAIEARDLVAVQLRRFDSGLRGLRGWVDAAASGTSSCVVDVSTSAEASRFLRARALGMALLGRRERLVTEASSRPQSIARAFATELLAPVDAIRARLSGASIDEEEIHAIAAEFAVTRGMVQHQIENHALARVA